MSVGDMDNANVNMKRRKRWRNARPCLEAGKESQRRTVTTADSVTVLFPANSFSGVGTCPHSEWSEVQFCTCPQLRWSEVFQSMLSFFYIITWQIPPECSAQLMVLARTLLYYSVVVARYILYYSVVVARSILY